jgi:carboxyl-terminal processing protease
VNKTLKILLMVVVGGALLVSGFSGGFVVGHLLPLDSLTAPALAPAAPPSTFSSGTQAGTPQDVQTLFKPFWEAWQIIHQQYVDQPVDDTKLMQGAINGMVNSLGDAHSTYMDPSTYKAATAELAGSYEGIGATVDTTGTLLTIISTFPGSPASKAGILPGDQITAVDHNDMTGINPELVRQKVIGPAGSLVHLTIQRAGQAGPFQFDITRAKIEVPSASGKMLPNNIAYIQVTTFGDNTTKELTASLKTLLAQNPRGLILDLRDNGGGYVNTAVEVVSQFQDHGVVLYEQHADGTKKPYEIIPGGLATKIPMVVLINAGTASASEITSGALQDYGRAKLVGVVSYGKGSEQNWVPLSNSEGAVRVTIAHWLTPNQRLIDHKGLTPDVYVPMTLDDVKAGRDPQLDAGVQVLMGVINGTPLPTSVPTPIPTVVPTP